MKAHLNIRRKAGLLYLLIVPLGVFGILFIQSYFVVEGDINATMENIQKDAFYFRLSILSSLATQVVQIFVVLALYQVFKDVNRRMAAFMVISILVAVPIAMLNELNHVAVLKTLGNGEQVSLFLSLHQSGVFMAQIFWGIWLFPMGYLAYKSGFVPKIIGVLLIIACFGYLFDSLFFFLELDFGFIFSDFTFVGEIAIILWLIIKGKK